MTKDNYSIRDLVTDLRRITSETNDEQEILSRIRPLARRAALSGDAWLEKRFYAADPEQGFGPHMLHEEPDHRLAVFAVSWLPDRGAPPHNQGTWAVVAGVDGPQKNVFFERTDDGNHPGHAELKKISERIFDFGEVLAMPSDGLHGIRNETGAVTVSLHIYGKHLNHTGRSQFDTEKKTETPFVVKIES